MQKGFTVVHREIPMLLPYRSTGRVRTVIGMAFDVILDDDTVERVEQADSYQQEGPLTTFFDNASRPGGLGAWSVKVASFRTDQILRIRRSAI